MRKLSRAGLAALATLAATAAMAARPAPAQAAFELVASPTPGGDAVLNAVAATGASSIWAVGERTGTGTLAMRWDGSRWRVARTPLSARPFAALDGDAAVALHDGGRGWTSATLPLAPGGMNALQGVDARTSRDVWAVGTVRDFATASSSTLVEHWNGSRWTVVPSPDPSGTSGVVANELTSVDARAADDVWAVGFYYDNTANVDRPLVLHWDGSSWTSVPAPGSSDLSGVAAVAADDVWAVGSDGSQAGVALHWDGDAWSAVATPTLSGCPTDVELRDVAAASATSVWAVGTCAAAGDPSPRSGRTLVEHWDGSAWTRVPSISPATSGDNELRGIATVPRSTALWSVGESGSDGLGAPAHTLAERQP
jgi:hypothetical protein